jgi:hypothetical protein
MALSVNALASMQEEINHLLKFVQQTNCQYERNGDFHIGVEAAKHINKKYAYFVDDIKSTEDFIKFSATKSSFSGKVYKVHCAGQSPVKSRDWLLTELMTYRKIQK